MKTSIVIDDTLMQEVLDKTGLPTKRAAVEAGLKALLKLSNQKQVLKYFGAVDWQGDLDDMRTNK